MTAAFFCVPYLFCTAELQPEISGLSGEGILKPCVYRYIITVTN